MITPEIALAMLFAGLGWVASGGVYDGPTMRGICTGAALGHALFVGGMLALGRIA